MPAFFEDVYDHPVVLVRDLRDDEDFVLRAYELHAEHCTRCAEPEGRTLCSRGRQYAIDVAKYVYSKNGKAYSAVDRDHNRPTLVKVPREYKTVRTLLLVLADGLKLHREETRAPLISYDATYPVAPRLPVEESYPSTQIIERSPRAARNRRVIIYRSPRGSPRRGSLYESDFVDRIERRSETWNVQRPIEYFR